MTYEKAGHSERGNGIYLNSMAKSCVEVIICGIKVIANS